MINSRNYLLIIIPYLTACSMLYQMIYWKVFDLNAFTIVPFADILASSAEPLLFSFLAAALGVFPGHYLGTVMIKKKNNDQRQEETGGFGQWIIFAVAACLCFWILWWLEAGITVWQVAVAVIIFVALDRWNVVFASDFNPRLNKTFLLQLFVYLPILSLCSGFTDAERIYDNKSFKYTLRQSLDGRTASDTLKLLGITGSGYVFVSYDNEEMVFITADTVRVRSKK